MKKNYIKKKLGYVQIHHVVSVRERHEAETMKGISRPFIISGVPEGHFSLCSDGILLPRRRRGEKFIVKHTVMHETVL